MYFLFTGPGLPEFANRQRRIITCAEVLEPETKALLACALQAPVVEIYEASEGQMACPCRSGNLHINEDLVYVELLDAQGLPVNGPADGRATVEEQLWRRFAQKLDDYGFACQFDIVQQPILLPSDNRKLKRFVRYAGV